MTFAEGLTGCLKMLQDQIAVSQHTLVAMQIFYHDNRRRGLTGCPGAAATSGSQSVLFSKCHGRVSALQPNCVGTLQTGPGLTSLMQHNSGH